MRFFKDKELPPMSLRALLVILLFLVGMIPVLIYGSLMLETHKQFHIDAKKIDLQSRALILSSRLTSTGYLTNTKNDELLETQIEMLADSYEGRIVIINRSFKIIKDTFNISVGKMSIAPEIINAFNGESTNLYNRENAYIVQTIPIYENSSNTSIAGVMLITSSTESIVTLIESVEGRSLILQITLGFIILLSSGIIATLVVQPLIQLKNDLAQVEYGNLSKGIHNNSYTITKSISENVNTTLDRLSTMDKSREEFVANVSHELKTPITSIRVLADSLMGMEEVPNELYKEFMNDISDEIDREAKIIDDLLSLVKLDKAMKELEIEQVDINLLLKQLLKRLRPIAAKRNIEITFESIREVSAEVDETKLSLAFNNLIENAIKYNREDGWVRVSLDADHKFFYVKVIDSGEGIALENQEAIFERFYRIDKARSRQTGGTGLGLAITKNVILLHQGIIKVTSKEGEGTTFMVRLPLKVVGKE